MQILQLSTAVPKNEYSTEELMEVFPCKLPEGIKRNILNLGVSKRYLVSHADSPLKSEIILSEADLVDLCLEAGKKAIEKASLSIRDVGYFIVTYDVNPFLCPGLSQLLVRKLGFNAYIKHVNVQGMACAAFSKALELAENHLAAHPEDSVLLCTSGVNSYWFYNQVRGFKDVMEISQIGLIKDKDKKQMELRKWIATMEFFLFGDGVASVIVAKDGDGLSVNKIVEVTNLKNKDYLAGYTRLTAYNEPFKFGLYSHLDKKIPKLGVKYSSVAVKKLLRKNAENTVKAAKKLAVHTGSEKILNIIAEHHQIQREKLVESYEVLREYGNLAGASLPFILEKIVSGNKFLKGDIILTLGYGWGFSASACLLEYKE
jgi:predicted naringenin-chalcone synthase